MIARRKKVCISCQTERYIYAKKMCRFCYQRYKPPKAIAKRSRKGQKSDRMYSKLAKEFKQDNPYCKARLPGCTTHTVDVHHQKGRGKFLLVTEFWLPVCRSCHNIITEDSALAIREGFSFSRLSNH